MLCDARVPLRREPRGLHRALAGAPATSATAHLSDFVYHPQWGGISPTPAFWRGKRAIADLLGDGTHMIAVPLSDELTM